MLYAHTCTFRHYTIIITQHTEIFNNTSKSYCAHGKDKSCMQEHSTEDGVHCDGLLRRRERQQGTLEKNEKQDSMQFQQERESNLQNT